MAMSLSRPDPSSPASIADASFSTGRRGFDQHEVRDFLRMVAAELGRLQERERFLERELRTNQNNPDLSSVQLDEQTLTRLLGEETARVLTTARESAAEIRQKAELAAAQLLSEASDEATRVREEAEIEAARRRADAGADAEAELSMAKQQGREMVNEARAYRERVLSELARRRELAREQIEQLLHGRDRLVQSFERARLAAVDVIAELQPLGEPDEYVNLSPTTGPVPVMLPNSPRPETATDDPTTATDDSATATDGPAAATDDPATASGSGDLADGGEAAGADDVPVGQIDTTGEPAGDDVDGSTTATDTFDAGDEQHGAALEVTEAETEPEIDAETERETGDVAVVGLELVATETADAEVVELDIVTDVEPEGDAATTDAASADAASDEAATDDAATDDAATDEAATDDVASDEGVNVDGVNVEGVIVEAAAPGDDADGVDVVVDDTTSIVRSAASPARESSTDGRDDVVVDLFARLRADAASPSAVADDTEPAVAATATVTDLTATAAAPDLAAVSDADDADLTPEPTPFARRDAALTPLIVSSARRLKRVLADEQNGVLDALRRHEPVRSLDDLLPAAAAHLQRYTSAIVDDVLAAANAGASSAGRSSALRKADAGKAVAAADAVINEWITSPLRERLERSVADGDGDNSDIARRVRSVYREWKTQHIDDQLDDVFRAAHGYGMYAAFDQGAAVAWVADPDHEACADCNDNTLAGALGAGESFPTGHEYAPAHLGCRCLLLPADR